MLKYSIALFGVLFATLAFGQTSWQAKQANISFVIKNAGLQVDGSFSGFTGQVKFNPDKPELSVLEAEVKVQTISTGIGMRDNHLRKQEYFHAEKFPFISMKSKSIKKGGSSGYVGIFSLTMKGVSKDVEVPFSFTQTGGNAQMQGNFEINRRDFKVGGGSLVMSDKVKVNIELILSKSE
jgi:polyisoprenoid-binding protein YceI